MTKNEAQQAMREGKKVTHRFFQPDEFVFMQDTKGSDYTTEDGCTLSEIDFLTLRTDPAWDKDWSIYEEKQQDADTTIL